MYIYVKFLPGNLNISICPPPYLSLYIAPKNIIVVICKLIRGS